MAAMLPEAVLVCVLGNTDSVQGNTHRCLQVCWKYSVFISDGVLQGINSASYSFINMILPWGALNGGRVLHAYRQHECLRHAARILAQTLAQTMIEPTE